MAILAMLSLPALLAVAVTSMVAKFPGALLPLSCVALALAAAWYGLLRRGAARVLGATVAALGLVGAVVLLFVDGLAFEGVLIAAGLALLVGASRAALRLHIALPMATAPGRPVLFLNPRSGGGKATRFALAREARARGITPIELQPGDDLEKLVLDATAGGADGLAMAGGDGSQAIVAAIASELDLPYACVPAGTRNHFALDLGVNRDDVVGALDAFVDGGERRVDLATVNGRVFVNNVSLGLYAEAVQRPGYREAKLRTLLDLVPDIIGPGSRSFPARAAASGAPARCIAPGASGRLPASTSNPTAPSRPASTARRQRSTPRCASRPCPGRCGCGSRARIRAPRRRQRSRTAHGRPRAR
jgi:hypothetical protein